MIKLNLTAILVTVVLLVLLYFVIDQKFIQSEPKQNYDSIVGAKEHRIQLLRWDSTQLARKLRSLEIKTSFDSTKLHATIKRLQHNATQRKKEIDTTSYAAFNRWLRKRYPRTDRQGFNARPWRELVRQAFTDLRNDSLPKGLKTGQLKLSSPFTFTH